MISIKFESLSEPYLPCIKRIIFSLINMSFLKRNAFFLLSLHSVDIAQNSATKSV